jgi:hypothetical protein
LPIKDDKTSFVLNGAEHQDYFFRAAAWREGVGMRTTIEDPEGDRAVRWSTRIATRLARPLIGAAIAVFVFLTIWLAPVILEVCHFWGCGFLFWDFGVSARFFGLVAVASAGFLGAAVYLWRRDRQRVQELEKLDLPIIMGVAKLDPQHPEQIPLIMKLFEKYRKIILKKQFTGGYQNTGVYQVGIEGSRDGSIVPFDRVLKFATREQASQEVELYNTYIAGRLPQAGGRPVVCYVRDDIDLGAVIYELAQFSGRSTLLNFEEFYSQNDDRQFVEGIIRQLYDDDHLGRLHRPKGTLEHRDLPLYREYTRLSENLDRMTIALQDLGKKLTLPWLEYINKTAPRVQADLPGVGIEDLRNPLHWINNEFNNRLHANVEEPGCQGIVHGDLLSGNILIETLEGGGRLIWFIDFAHTRRDAHTLADFCRLEADIKFHLTETDEGSFPETLGFENALLSPATAADLVPSTNGCPSTSNSLNKAWGCIQAIRTEMADHLLGRDLTPFYLSLLYSTLPMVYYRQLEKKPYQKLYAFVSAAKLCERMS